MKGSKMEKDQQSTRQQLGTTVEQVSLGLDADSSPLADFALKSTVAGLGMLAQARMEVGRVNDPAEVEADAMALDFLRWQQSAGQQSAPAHEQISSGQTSRSSSNGTMETGGFAVGGDVESDISRETGRGSGLDGSTRGQFEGFFGVDLGGVRLHADSKAAELSRSLGAEAFTVGSDVFFGEGRFAPGSSSGMGLLAHELTHVVQQSGSSMRRVDPNAASLSRSPLAGLRTISRNPRVDQNDSNKLSDGEGVVSQTEQVAGAAGGFSGLQEFEKPLDFRASGAPEVDDPEGFAHGEGFALISSTMNTISSIEKLWQVFSEPSTTEEKIWTVFGGLKAATDLSKSAVEASKAASIGAAVIPGLGLAISVMSFADNLMNTFLPLLKARKSEKVVLDNLRAKEAGTTDPAAKKALSLQIASMETLVTTSGRQIGFSVVDMVADLTMIVGQVATLAAGPFGAAVTLLGATLSLGSLATKTVWEWISSHKAAKSKEAEGAAKGALDASRTKFEEASQKATSAGATADDRKNLTAARDDLKAKEDAYDDAYLALVQSDANSAYKNVLDMAFAPLRETPPQVMDPGVKAMLSAHGVSDNFINKTSAEITANKTAEIEYEVAIEEAAALIAVGPPITMMDRVKGWVSSVGKSFGRVKAWFKSFGGPEVLPEATVTQKYVDSEALGMTSVLGKYVKKKAQQGTGGVKPAMVNDYLKGPFKSFVARVMSGATEQVEKDRRLGYIVISSVKAVKAALAGASTGGALIDMSTVQVDVTENSITVSYSSVPAPAAAQTPATTTTATVPVASGTP
jgi:hypothetical protein